MYDAEKHRDSDVAKAIRASRLIVVIREFNAKTISDVTSVIAAGAKLIEFSMDDPKAPDQISYMRKRTARFIGGRVETNDQARRAIDAGAQFLVSPYTDPMVIRTALEKNTPFIPGGFSANELKFAWDLEATFVNVFPAGTYGHLGLKPVLQEIMPVETIASGGVHFNYAHQYLNAGAVAVELSIDELKAPGVNPAEIIKQLALKSKVST